MATPLFSFLTDRRILGNAHITDTETFANGLLDLEALRDSLASDARIKFVIMTDHGGYLSTQNGRLIGVLSRYFRTVGAYRGVGETIYLWRRVAAEPMPR